MSSVCAGRVHRRRAVEGERRGAHEHQHERTARHLPDQERGSVALGRAHRLAPEASGEVAQVGHRSEHVGRGRNRQGEVGDDEERRDDRHGRRHAVSLYILDVGTLREALQQQRQRRCVARHVCLGCVGCGLSASTHQGFGRQHGTQPEENWKSSGSKRKQMELPVASTLTRAVVAVDVKLHSLPFASTFARLGR